MSPDPFIRWCDWLGSGAWVWLDASLTAALWLVGVVTAMPGAKLPPAMAPTFGAMAAVGVWITVREARAWWRRRPWRRA